MMDHTRAHTLAASPSPKCGYIALVISKFMLASTQVIARQKTTDKTTPASSYHYDLPDMRLEGTLNERKVYGPPGYGETPAKDERTTILILKLPNAITVEPLADAKGKDSPSLDTARHIHEIQLFIGRSRIAETRKLLGKEVVAVGTLNEAVAPSQYTKVWLDTRTLTAKATSTTH